MSNLDKDTLLNNCENRNSFVLSLATPQIKSSITSAPVIRVYHKCFGKCIANYYPSLLRDSLSKCIECITCRLMMTPRRFVGHTHGAKESHVCHWGFNSYNWPFYIKPANDQRLSPNPYLNETELLTKFQELLLTPNRDCEQTGEEDNYYQFDQPELDVGLKLIEQNARQQTNCLSSPPLRQSLKTKSIRSGDDGTSCNKMIKLAHDRKSISPISSSTYQKPFRKYHTTPSHYKPLSHNIRNQHLAETVSDIPIFVIVEGQRVAAYSVAGEPHLCLPQLLHYLKQKFTLKRLVSMFEESRVDFLSASSKQIEGFIAVSVLPVGASGCPLIKRSDADKICLSLYEQCYTGTRGNILNMLFNDHHVRSVEFKEASLLHKIKSNHQQKVIGHFDQSKDKQTLSHLDPPHQADIISNSNCKLSSYKDQHPDKKNSFLDFNEDTECPIVSHTHSNEVPTAPSIRVYHRCYGKCVGNYYPSLLVDSLSKCIQCATCHIFMTPRRFVGHTHGTNENNVCHWGFNSYNWPFYIKLANNQKLALNPYLNETELLTKFQQLLLTPNRDCEHTSEEDSDYRFDQPELDIGLKLIEQNAQQQTNYSSSPMDRRSLKTKSSSSHDEGICCNKMIKLAHGRKSVSPISPTSSSYQKPFKKYHATPLHYEPRFLHTTRNQHPPDSVSNSPTFVLVEGQRIAAYSIAGEPHLCLPQLLHYLKQKFTLKRMVGKFEESRVDFVSASAAQLEGFIAMSVLPVGASACPLIKRSDADKICLGLYEQCYQGNIADIREWKTSHFTVVK